eukprot:TRINITY_DN58423_c0_g1_i1.p1 TRINITY_DN58423_c0_g1~~TRINITY_DN58423_c0_g1_i1.p1  ORF type:complete len:566 (-),score=27.36 TRINITY_DN58423_c0_g1_i1:160-1857(-)
MMRHMVVFVSPLVTLLLLHLPIFHAIIIDKGAITTIPRNLAVSGDIHVEGDCSCGGTSVGTLVQSVGDKTGLATSLVASLNSTTNQLATQLATICGQVLCSGHGTCVFGSTVTCACDEFYLGLQCHTYTPTPTATSTSTHTTTVTATETETVTSMPTGTPTSSKTATHTTTQTLTSLPTHTSTDTTTHIPTYTLTSTATATDTPTTTETVTPTTTPTATPTQTRTSFVDGCNLGGGATKSTQFKPQIFGCNGVWTTEGISNGAYLCGPGFSICEGDHQVLQWGLTLAECKTIPAANEFFATLQGGDGGGLFPYGCHDTDHPTQQNDVFGCGGTNYQPADCCTSGADDKINKCDALNTFFSHTAGAFAGTGWNVGSYHNTELVRTTHTNAATGGVLCCANGCSQWDDATEFVPGRVYGCSGSWSTAGINNGDYLCASGYHICETEDELIAIGMNKDLCQNRPAFNDLFLTKISGKLDPSVWGCEPPNDPSDDDLFGCGGGHYTPHCCSDPDGTVNQCSIMNTFISTLSGGWLGSNGWNVDGSFSGNERNGVRHTSSSGGGVLCCID